MVTYDELSNLIGTCPDLAIFRRFGPLAAQVLLRMQAELLELDDDLKVLVGVEQQDSDLRGHAKSWGSVNDFVDAGGRSLRRETVLKAEEKLSRYCEFLKRQWCAALFDG